MIGEKSKSYDMIHPIPSFLKNVAKPKISEGSLNLHVLLNLSPVYTTEKLPRVNPGSPRVPFCFRVKKALAFLRSLVVTLPAIALHIN